MTNTAEIVQLDERRLKVVRADTDEGWHKMSNALSLKLCSVKLSDQEGRVFNAIRHMTLGYRKEMDWVSATQIADMTGIAANKISEIKKRLVERKILIVDGRKTGINLILSEWLDKPITPKQGYKRLPLNRVKNTPVQDENTPEQGKNYPQTGAHHKKIKAPKEEKDLVGKPDHAPICQRVIDHLNQKTGKAFKNVKSHQKFISARLKEGYSESDLITVIDRKAGEWLNDPRMNEYLRPSTLFNSDKFDGYLNAKPTARIGRRPASSFDQVDYFSGAEGFEHV